MKITNYFLRDRKSKDINNNNNNNNNLNNKSKIKESENSFGSNSNIDHNIKIKNDKHTHENSKNIKNENIKQQENELSEYEMMRLKKIQENERFLSTIGLTTLSKTIIPVKVTKKSHKIKINDKKNKNIRTGTRRSRRLCNKEPITLNNEVELSNENTEILNDEQENIEYDDSTVVRYICNTNTSKLNNEMMHDSKCKNITGFSLSNQLPELNDNNSKKKMYSIDFSPINPYFVTAGQNGRIIIFGLPDENNIKKDKQNNENENVLLSFNGHSSWVSGVSLTLNNNQTNKSTLVTTGNDGFLKIWDLNQMQKMDGKNIRNIPPKMIYGHSSIHSSGIFSLDIVYMNQSSSAMCLTGSKDKTIALSQISNDSVKIVHVYDELEQGIIKDARFRHNPNDTGNIFVSCGNSSDINIIDTRQNKINSIIKNANTGNIHSVQWHPISENLLLTAGYDPFIRLYDTRKVNEPLYKYIGHSDMNCRKHRIYHPIFLEDGKKIVVNGSGSTLLSLYSSETGETISRGEMVQESSAISDISRFSHFNIQAILVANGSSLRFFEFQSIE